jgi:hypothetical protein
MRNLLAAAAVLALAATATHADPGKGKGGGHDAGPAAHAKGAGGQDRGKAASAKPDRGPAAVKKQDRGPDRVAQQSQGAKADRGPGQEARGKGAGKPAKVDRSVDRRGGNGRDAANERRDGFDRDNQRRVDRVARFDFRDNRGLIDGCPPGLAKKHNGCTPPGLLKQHNDDRYREAFYRPDWWGYGSLGDRVFYDDGYLYRLGSNNSVLGYIPLLGGALSVGQIWPSMYQPLPVPDYYASYYNLGPQGAYRYADNVLYRVDPETTAITSIAALLTGDQFAIGQPLPLGYDVYNVPYAYRDRYYDTPDAMYRYADGYVYQVDPETQLIAAAIELLT